MEKILSSKVSNLIKAQIMKNIYAERSGQLLDLSLLYGICKRTTNSGIFDNQFGDSGTDKFINPN